MKENYTQYREEKKHPGILKLNKQMIFFAMAALVVVASGFILSRWLSNTRCNTLLQDASVTSTAITPVNNSVQATEGEKNMNETAIKNVETKDPESSVHINKATPEGQIIKLPAAVQKALSQQIIKQNNNLVSAAASTSIPSQIQKENTNASHLLKNISVSAKTIPASNHSGIKAVLVTIINNSDKVLKETAVTITYLNATKKITDKKIIYFSNVQPGSTLTLKAPGNKDATTVQAQLSLTSTKDSTLILDKH